jgi:D-glycero-alpha-D-manno-heptose 1-phosphate guanylyltransferase
MNMTAIILAGGLATRMGEICYKTPKSMLEFAGYPFLLYLVSWLVRLGLNEVLISTGRLSDKVESVFSTGFWSSKGVKVVKENSPLGTGGATKFACENCSNEDVFLCNGDTIVALSLFRSYEIHKVLRTPVTAVLTLSKEVPNQGAVSVENGIVTEFCEGEEAKDPIGGESYFRGSSTGCYFLKRSSALSLFPSGSSSLERKVLPSLVSAKMVGAVNNGFGFFLDYGISQRYEILKNNLWILKRIYGEPITGGSENEKQD